MGAHALKSRCSVLCVNVKLASKEMTVKSITVFALLPLACMEERVSLIPPFSVSAGRGLKERDVNLEPAQMPYV